MSEQSGGAASAAPSAESSAPVTETQESNSQVAASEAKEGSAPAADSKGAPKVVKEAAKKVDAEKIPGTQKYKLVVDGVEEELSQEELVKYAQKAKAADKRFQESAQIKKEAAELIQMLRDNPERVLADPAILGNNEKVLEFAQRILQKQMEESQKPQAVREKEALERELEQLRADVKKREDDRQKDEYDRLVKQHETQLEEQIQDAMETSGLPKSPYVLKKLADVMISSMEFQKEITPKQAMAIVKREMQKEMREHFDLTPEDALEELLGDNLKRIRKRQVAKIKAEQAAPTASQIKAPASKVEPSSKESPKINMKNWLRSR